MERPKFFKYTQEQFEYMFGHYYCNKCGKAFTMPEARYINMSKDCRQIKEYCECGGKFLCCEEDKDFAFIFRPFLSFDEAVEFRKSQLSQNNILKTIEKNNKRKENNELVKKSNEFVKYVEEKKIEELPTLIQKRNAELKELADEFYDKYIKEDKSFNKVDGSLLLVGLSKPFVPVNQTVKKYSAYDLQSLNDYFWDKVKEFTLMNTKLKIVPTIYNFCSMIGMSYNNFTATYVNCDDAEMKETCNMIKDRFASFYVQKGLSREISEVMSMFTLKCGYDFNDKPEESKFVIEHKLISDNVLEDSIIQVNNQQKLLEGFKEKI